MFQTLLREVKQIIDEYGARVEKLEGQQLRDQQRISQLEEQILRDEERICQLESQLELRTGIQ